MVFWVMKFFLATSLGLGFVFWNFPLVGFWDFDKKFSGNISLKFWNLWCSFRGSEIPRNLLKLLLWVLGFPCWIFVFGFVCWNRGERVGFHLCKGMVMLVSSTKGQAFTHTLFYFCAQNYDALSSSSFVYFISLAILVILLTCISFFFLLLDFQVLNST